MVHISSSSHITNICIAVCLNIMLRLSIHNTYTRRIYVRIMCVKSNRSLCHETLTFACVSRVIFHYIIFIILFNVKRPPLTLELTTFSI